MILEAGARLGSYEIAAALGAGGMGEVYRAKDTKLGRDVAIKILPAAVATDPERLARFKREAQLLAALNHPNIAAIYGLDEADGKPFLVLELVPGEDLAERLKRGAIPSDEAIAIAKQIAEALEEAHEKGIVHRDLKPANVKLTPDGKVKVLDFGLAKAYTSEASDARSSELSHSPTLTRQGTEAGMILGTAAYMSPEQARGKPVDKRADIWAFGSLVYEMLVGKPAFAGETTTDILAAVVQNEPDWSRLPEPLPAGIVLLLRRCLQKQAKDRLRDIGDARFEIDPRASAIPATGGRTGSPARGRAFFFGIGAVVAAGALLLPRALWPAPEAPAMPVRAIVSLPPDTTLALGRGSAVAVSPDGRRLAFTGRAKGKVQLYVRPLDRFESQPIAGTDGAANPFFSPDGQWVGFFADGKLKKVSLDGGAPVVVTDARTPRGEAWGDGNSILLTPSNNTSIMRVSALGGGKLEPVTALAAGEMSHRWPRLLPDGKAVLYSIWNDAGWEPARIAVKRLDGDGSEPKLLVPGGGGYARYIRDGARRRGYLVYARSEGILAAPFDESRLEVTGQAVPVVDGVLTNLSGGAHFDLSAGGTLAYVPGTTGESERDLSWVALDGQATPALRIHGMSRFWTLSPDGTRVARNNTAGPSRDVWIDSLANGARTRVTHADDNFSPIWSADGNWVAFARGIPFAKMIRRKTDGSEVEEQLSASSNYQQPSSFSPDGTALLYSEFDPAAGSDIWVLTLPAAARPFVKTNFSEGNASFSPDGRWVAYQSNESGRFEIYVRPYPEGIRKFQVSTEGGVSAPLWSPSGREIFYRATSGVMMAASVETAPDFRTGTPRALFDGTGYEPTFGVSPDGRRLLMMPLIATESAASEVHLVLNFQAELRQRVR